MAKSKAKKTREKLVREGFRNPENSRSIFAFVDMRKRATKTKKGKMNQVKHKKRLSDHDSSGNDNRFSMRPNLVIC